jgi:transcriptional regulator with XRE-family HTH domain
MKAARENFRDPKEGKTLSRRELARRLYMSHSNLTDYENGHRLPPGEIVQAYERELKLPPSSLVDLWEQARVELLGKMRTRQRRWVPPVTTVDRSPEVPDGWRLDDPGGCHITLGRLGEAIDCLQQALRIHRETGNRYGEARTLGHLAVAYWKLGHLEQTTGDAMPNGPTANGSSGRTPLH